MVQLLPNGRNSYLPATRRFNVRDVKREYDFVCSLMRRETTEEGGYTPVSYPNYL